MARVFASISVLCMLVAFSGARSFDDANSIDMVTDKIGGLEYNMFKVLGTSATALQFAEFALRYGKNYGSLSELVQRYNVFVGNMELIESTNSMNLPYTLGVNEFADLTWEEFKGHRLGASQNCSATKSNHKMTDAVLPETKDWREVGIVSPVKNQGHCGSCWTFSTTGALEAAYTQATGKTVSLSEQQLVDCAGAFNNFGCSGGLPSQAFEYIKYNGGLDTEETYPYTAKDGVCKYDVNNVGAKVADAVNISLGAEDELKHAVGLVRPVSVAFEVINEFRFYKGGVFTSTHCAQGPMDVNHAVLAVGYGVSEEGTPYWIIKNSWGESWGVNGYFSMEMGKNMCGVATCASYPVVAEFLE
uniref:Peptidase C1A papain C-terminal domain-containing protein n=1 Tax=Araucaria cunninghamii TaxID=56994 RepID=A0A0D6R7U7_ARACU